MDLEILAVSDTHLGEDTSLLSYPHGRRHLWRTLRECFGERFTIEELVLVGDIADATISSTSQIHTHTNAFCEMMGSVATIKKAVYVPGNHDHTVWTECLTRPRDGSYPAGVTNPAGRTVVEDGKLMDTDCRALVELFFGYECGSSWRAIEEERDFKFVVANPLYAKSLGGRTYVFTHGTHFRPEITMRRVLRRALDILQLDRIIGGIEVESRFELAEDDDLETMEGKIAEAVDTLFPRAKNDPTPKTDQAYYLYQQLRAKSGIRESPPKTEPYEWGRLPHTSWKKKTRIPFLTPKGKHHKSISRWDEFFLQRMLDYLTKHNLPDDPLTFVYGDTHTGGWGEWKGPSGQEIRIFNCGAWISGGKGDHPPCHVFAVAKDEGEDGAEHFHESILDVSFKGVKVEGESLVELAGQDAENKPRKLNPFARLFA